MPFEVPTQAAVIRRVEADFRAEAGVNPLRRSPEYALLKALAGQSKGLYSHQEFIFRQAFLDTAEEHYFWRWAAIWDITQKPATPWKGIVRFTGTDGTLVPEGTELARSDGARYTTDADGSIGDDVSGYVDIACTAVDDGLTTSNADGSPLSLSSGILNVSSDCTVQSTTTDGVDLEVVEDAMVRLLERIQNPPSGGGTGDYVNWALEVSGVTRAWESSPSPGEVSVSFVRDNDGSGSAILPSSGERDEVEEHVQSKAPITVEVSVVTLSALNIGVEITDLDPDTSDVRDAIEASIQDFFLREAEPGGTLKVSRLRQAISDAVGEFDHTLVDFGGGLTDVTADDDEMPIFTGLTVS